MLVFSSVDTALIKGTHASIKASARSLWAAVYRLNYKVRTASGATWRGVYASKVPYNVSNDIIAHY